jgi:hypothetical protein
MRAAGITILSAILLQIAVVMPVPAQAQNEGMGVLGPIKKDEDAGKRERPRRATEEKLRQQSRPAEAKERPRTAPPPVEAARPGGGSGSGKSQIGVGF